MSGSAAMSQAQFTCYGPELLRSIVGFEDVMPAVRGALESFSEGLGEAPAVVFAPAGRRGDVHVKCAWLPGHSLFTVKVATWFEAKGMAGGSAAGGVVAAFDARTGDLRALLEDQHHLSDVRTAAAGALAAAALARPESVALGVIGTGTQAYLQCLAHVSVLPLRLVRIWGRSAQRAALLRRALGRRLAQIEVEVVPTPREACLNADVIVTATASTEPLVEAGWLQRGAHVTAVGADDATKCELAPACFTRADRIVVDSRALTARFGDFARALAQGAVQPDRIAAELGDVLAGRAAGRTHADEITIAKLVGVGVQDLAAVEVALERLASKAWPAQVPACAGDLERPADA